MVNQLASESSAYLRKHKDNPVNWYPWGEEAFEKAQQEDKPLFISIGYFSCHWCSVMERESFEDAETAKFMNEHFINIKVDREEHPDLDKVYQRYYNTLTGESGGWPLNVYAFADGLPFYITTYLPKSFNLRSRTFMSLNREIANSWEQERDDLFDISAGLSRNLDSSNQIMVKSKTEITDEILVKEITNIQERMDWKFGGVDRSPKFPRFSLLRFLLKEGHIRQAEELIRFVKFTFDKMSRGGIYDQLGGGLARYSVDRKWQIPHFEKMLYDQAGWLRLAAELYAVTTDDYILYIIEDMLHFLQSELQADTSSFYSSIDAESEGPEGEESAEGRFYAFTHDEIKQLLDDSYWGVHFNAKWFRIGIGKPEFLLNQDYKIAKLRYGISRWGNFNDPHGQIIGANILKIDKSIGEISENLDINRSIVVDRLNVIRQKLYSYQQSRPHPAIDKKIITAWNAMLSTALFQVYEKTGLEKAKEMAIGALDFITTNHLGTSTIRRSSHPDFPESSVIEGILDDYVFLIEALIQGYETTDDFSYLQTAEKVLKLADEKFYDQNLQIYYLNKSEAEQHVGRILSAMDDSFQSALAVQVGNLYKLGQYLEKESLVQRGQDILLRLAEPASEYEASMSELFISAGYYLRYPDEVVLVSDNGDLEIPILKQYLPERLIYRWPRTDNAPYWGVVQNRENRDEATVFICRGASCSLPLTEEESIIIELSRN